jgi:hypothetical protein
MALLTVVMALRLLLAAQVSHTQVVAVVVEGQALEVRILEVLAAEEMVGLEQVLQVQQVQQTLVVAVVAADTMERQVE